MFENGTCENEHASKTKMKIRKKETWKTRKKVSMVVNLAMRLGIVTATDAER